MNQRTRRTSWLGLAAFMGVFSLGTLRADTTFANYFDPMGSEAISYTVTGTAPNQVASFMSASFPVDFYFSNVPNEPIQGIQAATLTVNASSTQAAVQTGSGANKTDSQGGFNGSFVFTLVTPYNGQSQLLTVNFTGATLTGNDGGNSAAFTLGVSSQVSFSSNFLAFGGTSTRSFSINLSGVTPDYTLNSTTGFLQPFTTASGGAFSSNPIPTSSIPEPATLGMVGLSLAVASFAGSRLRKNSRPLKP